MNKFMHTRCFLQRVSSIHPIPLRWIEEPHDPGNSSYIAALLPQTQISSRKWMESMDPSPTEFPAE